VADDLVQHVFVSYVREDSEAVDRLCEVLTAAGIPYWRDRTSLAPGDAWKAKIREAIRSGSLVFLACFSDNSRAKAKSYMNEELTLAVEEFRQMPPGRTWLIPVRLDDGPIPEWDLGAGRTFDDINYVDFFGQQVPTQSASLAITISRIMGNQGSDPVVARAAVSDSAETVGLSSQIQDPGQERQLFDLLRRAADQLLELPALAADVAVDGTPQVIKAEFTVRRQRVEEAARPLLKLVANLAYWGRPSTDRYLTSLIPQLAPNPHRAGSADLLNLLRAPGSLLFHCAGVAMCAAERDEAVGKLLGDDLRVADPYAGELPAVASLHADLVYPDRDANRALHDYLADVMRNELTLSNRTFEQAWARWNYLTTVACSCLRAAGAHTYPPRAYLQITSDGPGDPYVTVGKGLRREIAQQGDQHPLLAGGCCRGSADLLDTAADLRVQLRVVGPSTGRGRPAFRRRRTTKRTALPRQPVKAQYRRKGSSSRDGLLWRRRSRLDDTSRLAELRTNFWDRLTNSLLRQ